MYTEHIFGGDKQNFGILMPFHTSHTSHLYTDRKIAQPHRKAIRFSILGSKEDRKNESKTIRKSGK